jgi:hypothetical protein
LPSASIFIALAQLCVLRNNYIKVCMANSETEMNRIHDLIAFLFSFLQRCLRTEVMVHRSNMYTPEYYLD